MILFEKKTAHHARTFNITFVKMWTECKILLHWRADKMRHGELSRDADIVQHSRYTGILPWTPPLFHKLPPPSSHANSHSWHGTFSSLHQRCSVPQLISISHQLAETSPYWMNYQLLKQIGRKRHLWLGTKFCMPCSASFPYSVQ